MISWLKRIFTRQKPLDIRFVVDSELNRSNLFWSSYIGMPVSVLGKDPEGMMSVQLHDQPVPVQWIDPKRFT